MPMPAQDRNLPTAQDMAEQRPSNSSLVRGEIQFRFFHKPSPAGRQSSATPSLTECMRMTVYQPETHVDRVRRLRCPNGYPRRATVDVQSPAANTVIPPVETGPERSNSMQSGLSAHLENGVASRPPSTRPYQSQIQANAAIEQESASVPDEPTPSSTPEFTEDDPHGQQSDSGNGLSHDFLFPALSRRTIDHSNAPPVQQADETLVFHSTRKRQRSDKAGSMPTAQESAVRRRSFFDAYTSSSSSSSGPLAPAEHPREGLQTTTLFGQRTRPDSTVEFDDLIITRSTG